MIRKFQQKLKARRDGRLEHSDGSDAGFTLPELLVTIFLSGLLVSVIATSITVMLNATPEAEARLSESKDITFLQTFIPVDLATAINSYDSPDDAVVRTLLANNAPNVNYNQAAGGANLMPGTNVLTLVIPNADTGLMEIISYRYVERGPDDWQLVRFRIENPGTGSQTVSPVGVAHEIPSPPAGWVEGDPVDHAFEVTARNQVVLRPVGEDITVTFDSGNQFSTGGAGLSAEQSLTPNDPVTLPDPTAPPTRCGGRVVLMLDTSFSVPRFNGGGDLESAAVGFLDAFSGTPTNVSVMGFDQIAYQLYPNLLGDRGEYFNLLDSTSDADGSGSPDIQEAKNNVLALPNVDTAIGNEQGGSYYYGPNNGGIGWTQNNRREDGTRPPYNGGTNWEEAMHAPFFDQSGVLRPQTPELVVWITDGSPNRQRSDDFSGVSSNGTDVNAAAAAANAGRSTGARVIGVLVGPGGEDLEGNLAEVVGSNKWDGQVLPDSDGDGEKEIVLGNAVAADYFLGSFDDLGSVLRTIIAAQCGGTVTVRKQLDNGSNPGGRWNYSTETGDQVLDLDASASITFDFAFDGETTRDVTIREEVQDGYTFVRADCTSGGQPMDPGRVVQQPDDITGVQITLEPDEAVSCIMVSQPE